jgi:N-acetylmuramoyl-L-alanine amidase
MTKYTKTKNYLPNPTGITVLIDPGHGGMIDGIYTTAPAKMYDHGDFIFYEGVYNRELAIKVGDLLAEEEINYSFVTNSNYDISLPIRVRYANNFAEGYQDLTPIYLSLHGNAEGTGKASGIEIFTSTGETDSDKIATFLFYRLAELGWNMRSDISDGDVDKESKFYVLRKTKIPAVLIESGFFTNKQEALMMMDSDVQQIIADKIVLGIKDYIESI